MCIYILIRKKLKKKKKKKLDFFFKKNGGMCEDCVPMFPPPFWRVLDMGLASGHASPYVPSLKEGQWALARGRASPLLPPLPRGTGGPGEEEGQSSDIHG